MKHTKPLAWLAAIILSGSMLLGCSESEGGTEEYPNWKATNDTYFNNLYQTATKQIASGSTQWKIIANWSYNADAAKTPDTHIVVEVLKQGTGSGCPFYSDSVRVHYQGRLLPSVSYPAGRIFEQTWTGAYDTATNAPKNFLVSRLVDGFATALQHMHIGDRWRVYIPYQLGYGSKNTSNGLPACSTLIFDITLSAYARPGVALPTRAQRFVWIEE